MPYKGGTQHLTDIMGGTVDMAFDVTPASMQFVRGGKVRALAITGTRRSAAVPELPTFAESGLPGYAPNGWYGIVAPTGTPREIVARLSTELLRLLTMPDVREQLARISVEPGGGTPEEFGEFIRSESVTYGTLLRKLAVPVE